MKTKETDEHSGTSVLHETSEHWQNREELAAASEFVQKNTKYLFAFYAPTYFPNLFVPHGLRLEINLEDINVKSRPMVAKQGRSRAKFTATPD